MTRWTWWAVTLRPVVTVKVFAGFHPSHLTLNGIISPSAALYGLQRSGELGVDRRAGSRGHQQGFHQEILARRYDGRLARR
jgi:hypothetical protein